MKYKCPKCGNMIEEGVPSCNICNQPFTWPEKTNVTPLEAEPAEEPLINTALINCPACGKEVYKGAANCVHCGFPINNQFTSNSAESATNNLTISESSNNASKGTKVLFFISLLMWPIGLFHAFRITASEPKRILEYLAGIHPAFYTSYDNSLLEDLAKYNLTKSFLPIITAIVVLIFIINAIVIYHSGINDKIKKIISIVALILTIASFLLMLPAGNEILMIFAFCLVPLICTVIFELLLIIKNNN